MKEKTKHKIKFSIFVFLVVIFVIVPIVSYVFGYESTIQKKLSPLYSLRVFPLIYIGLFIISAFFPLPFLTFLGATIFSFGEVFVYSLLGNLISLIILFYVARWLGKDYVDRYLTKNPKLKNIKIGLEKNAFKNIIFLRFFYLVPPEFPSLIGGVSNMKFKDYFLASFIGVVPLTLASIMLIQSSQKDNNTYFMLSVIFMGVLLLIPILYMPTLKDFVKKKIDFQKKFKASRE